MALAPNPAPGAVPSFCICENEPVVAVCVCEKAWKDLTHRALAQLNKLAAPPLPVFPELIIQLGDTQIHTLSPSRGLLLSNKHHILRTYTDHV